MTHTYRVTGTVIKGGVKDYEIIVIGDNIKDAKAIALGEWESVGGKNIGHLFHLSAHRTNKTATIHNMMWHKTGEKTPEGNWLTYV